MIKGIPYFGEQTQEIVDSILNIDTDIIYEKKYDSLYDLILSNIDKHIIVVIDNKWLTWLNDIVFNYRDRECYIPYYTYKEQLITDRTFRTNNKGHLILDGDNIRVRYEYSYHKLNITVDNLALDCVDIDTQERLIVRTNNWINEAAVDFDKLHKLYVESSYKDDDFIMNKHAGGYHYITLSPKEFVNRERKLREQYDLSDYSEDFYYIKDYRDVRQYKYEEVIKLNGLLDNIELYRERRLRFESYLYCCLRAGLFNNIQFKKHIYKLGKELKLIIKDYWLDNIDKPNKTYIR